MGNSRLSIIQAMLDPNLFGSCFQGASWGAWKVFLKAVFGICLDSDELELFEKCTSRRVAPQSVEEAWLIVGRRGGKSIISALVAVYLACFRNYLSCLAPGEVATVMCIAADRRQARVVMRYVNGFFDSVPMLANLITRRTRDIVELSNRVVIEIHTASYRTIRGYSVAAVIADEIAFWRSEDSANPDTEILNGLRPGMLSIPGGLLLCIGTPYSRRGEMWSAYQRFFGKEDDSVLVWKADTRSMNPAVSQRFIKRQYERDAIAAAAEYGAEFRRDIESFVTQEAVEAVVVPQRYELAPLKEIAYFAFVDPSGGSQDSMALAIAHRIEDLVVLDAVRERKPPFSPEGVVAEFSELLRLYRIRSVTGDRYAGEWPREQFRKRAIEYKLSEKTASDLYREFLPVVNSGKVELLDHPGLLNQMCSLERRTSRTGKDTISHPPGGHDDLANAVAGALTVQKERPIQIFV